MEKFDYLVVGSGLYGAIFAHETKAHGKSVLVVDKRPNIAGNIYTESVEGINVHKYGAHIFHTNNKKVWSYITQFAEFNRFTNSPVANYKSELYQIREASIENQKFTIKKMDCIKTAQMMLDDIKANHPELLKAARSRYVAANFHILAQINDNIPEKRLIINNIKRMRGLVLRDKLASIRVRGACLLSFVSFDLTIFILNLKK